MVDIVGIIGSLAKDRPVFHSEADFQHALAWKIHEGYPELNVRLERRVVLDRREIYADIFLFKDDESLVAETKYKTRSTNVTLDGEVFNLKNQAAQDIARYDFLKDVSRIERISGRYGKSSGIALFLTNDPSYWRPSRSEDTVDSMFRLHDRRIIKGRVSWKDGTSNGTMSGREEPIVLEREYQLRWRDYSNLNVGYGRFRYLLIESSAV